MREIPARYDAEQIRYLIVTVRGQPVILDADLARIYGVPTKRLNEQVKRNRKRFPGDFVLHLTTGEVNNLKSQFATSSSSPIWSQFSTNLHGGRRKLPNAFTEQGAIMAANVLNSPQAVKMSVFVVRAFVRMRQLLLSHGELARKLAELEKMLTARLNTHERAIVHVLEQIMRLLKPTPGPEPSPKQIGFHTRERGASYKTKSRTRRL